jgi:RHS repeat-associated protein
MWYPSGRYLTYGYDGAGRVDAASGQMGSTVTNYTSASVQPAITYWPHGAVNTLALGNGVTETTTYNNRLQAQQIQAGSLLTLGYGYGTANNGNVQSQTITRGGSVWAQTYGYDGVNRLTSASEAGTGTWSEGYGYDAFGNRWLASRLGLPGVTAETPTGQSWYANTPVNNQVVGWGYDGAGNLASIAGGVRSSSYDAENRMTSATENGATTNYAYDGEGRRVMKTSGTQTTVYVYDAGGELAAEYGSSASVSGTEYLTADALGSTRLVTDANGAAVRCYDYLPFGEEIASGTAGRSGPCFAPYSSSPDIVSQKFTGKERDAETGLDYFGARYFSGAQGRFTSPDWSARPQPIPYADLSDPQSLNPYAYVRNNPLRRVDPDGHSDVASMCQGKENCSVAVTQAVNLYAYDKKAKAYTVYSTLSVTTNFSATSASGKISAVAASSTVANVSGHTFTDAQLATMGTNVAAIQQGGVTRGFGENTTQLLTSFAAKETIFGAASPAAGEPAFKDPAINPLQLSGGRATMDRQHNVEGGLDIVGWAGRPVSFDPRGTYTRFSGQPSGVVDVFMLFYNGLSETTSK